MGKKGIPGQDKKLSIPEAQETAKQMLTALAPHLKRYTMEKQKPGE